MKRLANRAMLPFVFICPECRTVYQKALSGCERDGEPLCEVQAHQSKARYPLLGRVVDDRYHLIGGLGQGGLGTVYLAQHLHLEQLFAVKFLDLETVGLDVSRDQRAEHLKDFMKEARVASLIRHDAVVRVSDFGEFDGLPYLVMDYVPGPSLLQMLAEHGRFEVPEAINIARRIAEALNAFHERQLVHRDLKPANVILDPRGNGQLTLVDLGLVKDISGHGGKASTHPMALRGTPGYLAPEQVPPWVISSVSSVQPNEKQLVDARVDVYALGVIFYEMVAGVSPYPDGSNTHIIVYACTRDPLPIGGVDPPVKLIPGLEELIYTTMARDPKARPQTARDFIDHLDEVALGRAMQGSWPVMVLPDSLDISSLPPPPTMTSPDVGGEVAHTSLYNVDGEASSPRPMEQQYGAADRAYAPTTADSTIEADPSDSFDLLLDDSIASFDTGLHQTDSMTEIQPEMGSTAVPTQLTPMPAGIETALNIEQMVEDPLPPPQPALPVEAGAEGQASNWIVLPAVFLASAVAVYLISTVVPDAAGPIDTTVEGVSSSKVSAPPPQTAAPVGVTPVISPPKPGEAPAPTTVDVAPPSPPKVAMPVPEPTIAPPPKAPPPKPKARRRGPKPRSTATRRLIRKANAAFVKLDCDDALPKYQELIGLLSRSDPQYSNFKDRIKFCKRRTKR